MKNNNPLHHTKTFQIAWGDMDALGHVNNGRYFDYFQEARIEWMANIQLHMTYQQGPVLVQTGCTFLKPVVYPATVTIKTILHTLGKTSMMMDQHLFQNDMLMAEGVSKIVWIDYTNGKPVAIPALIRDLFDKYA